MCAHKADKRWAHGSRGSCIIIAFSFSAKGLGRCTSQGVLHKMISYGCRVHVIFCHRALRHLFMDTRRDHGCSICLFAFILWGMLDGSCLYKRNKTHQMIAYGNKWMPRPARSLRLCLPFGLLSRQVAAARPRRGCRRSPAPGGASAGVGFVCHVLCVDALSGKPCLRAFRLAIRESSPV